mgnify:CR=1 FL=1
MAKTNMVSDDQICKAIQSSHGLIFHAAKKLGVTPKTVYVRAKQSKRIRAAIKQQRGETLDTAESRLFGLIKKNNLNAIKFLLETLGAKRGYITQTKRLIESDTVITHEQRSTIDLAKLPLELQQAIYDYSQSLKVKALPKPDNTTDAEIEPAGE